MTMENEQVTPAPLGPVERMVGRLNPKRAVVERVTDADIERAFDGTNFGRTDHKHLLALSVLKKALRYHCGHTVTQIMVQMGLTTEKGRVTEKGRLFCYEALDAGRSG
jgi:hypothetical protein